MGPGRFGFPGFFCPWRTWAFAKPCEMSRGTIANHLAVLEAIFVAHVERPFSKHKATEIVTAPKVYAFDTGFIAFWY